MGPLYLARIFVTLKPAVNDPQGVTIRGGLHSLGFTSVKDVRMGKFLEVTLDEKSRKQAEARVEEMCDKLLANPVIENFRFELEEVKAKAPTNRRRR
jgi:phosphoribosylformylglycinamidine synthase